MPGVLVPIGFDGFFLLYALFFKRNQIRRDDLMTHLQLAQQSGLAPPC